jgi:hypothetical protein
MSAMDRLIGITNSPTRELAEAFPGATVSGVTVLALVDPGDGFLCPISSGPDDENIAAVPEFDRTIMAATLRALADRWAP